MDHGHRRAKGLESLQIEPDGPQSASCRKNQIAGVTTATALRVQFARHVVGVTAAAEEDSAFPGPQIQDRHLRGIKATGPCENREQHCFSAGQPFGPCVIGFALLDVRPRENCRGTTRRSDSLQTGGSVCRGEDDGIVRSPCGAACGGTIDRGDGDRGPSAHRHFLQ